MARELAFIERFANPEWGLYYGPSNKLSVLVPTLQLTNGNYYDEDIRSRRELRQAQRALRLLYQEAKMARHFKDEAQIHRLAIDCDYIQAAILRYRLRRQRQNDKQNAGNKGMSS